MNDLNEFGGVNGAGKSNLIEVFRTLTAMGILREFIEDAANRTQVIVATQSPLLLDQFAIENIVVINRKDGQPTFERLEPTDYDHWLGSYSVGQLWTKNVIQGGKTNEYAYGSRGID